MNSKIIAIVVGAIAIVSLGIFIGNGISNQMIEKKRVEQDKPVEKTEATTTEEKASMEVIEDPLTNTEATTEAPVATTQPQVEPTTQAVEEEIFPTEMPYTDNYYYDMYGHTNLGDFYQVRSGDGSFSFAYPKYLFNASECYPEKNFYYFYNTNYSDLYFKVYSAYEPGDSRSIVNEKGQKAYGQIGDNTHYSLSDKRDSKGYFRSRFGGKMKNGDGIYFICAHDGATTYYFEYHYPEYYEGEVLNEVNYIVDCMYQYCSFSGSTKHPRSFELYMQDKFE